MAPARSSSYVLLALLVAIAGFFIVAAILMVTWNYTIPRLVESVDSEYKTSMYTNIEYPVAIVFTILIGILFGSSKNIGEVESWLRAGSESLTDNMKTRTYNQD
jgi:cell division protein FtsX